MSKIMIGFSGLILFACGYGLGIASAPAIFPAAPMPANNTHKESVSPLPLTESSQQNYRPGIAQENHAVNPPQRDSAKPTSTINAASTIDTAEYNRLLNYFMVNEQKKYNEYLKSINATPEKLHQVLSEDFNKEHTDISWASAQQGFLNNYISQNKILNRLSNVEAECRSQRCKISVLDNDPELITAIMNLANENEGRFANYIATVDPVTHVTNIYFDRNSALP